MAKITTMTPDSMKEVITPELLSESCQKFAQELAQIPCIVFGEQTGKYVTIVPGVRNQITFGELDGDAQLAPWSSSRGKDEDADYTIEGRTLVVYPGNCAKNFDPMPLFHSIYGESIALGQSMTAHQIARKVVALFAAKIGEHINDVIFKGGKRNVSGTTTADLFDSFDTIIENEITDSNLSADKGNLVNVAHIDSTNAVDELKKFYRSADVRLHNKKTFLYVSPEVYDAYVDDYQVRHGSLVYNKEYDKVFLEGSRNKCEFAVLDNMAGSKYLKLSTKPNFMLGTDIMSQENHCNVAKYSSWQLTFEYAGVYGLQIRSLDKSNILVGKIADE